jgi:hypothetical protein
VVKSSASVKKNNVKEQEMPHNLILADISTIKCSSTIFESSTIYWQKFSSQTFSFYAAKSANKYTVFIFFLSPDKATCSFFLLYGGFFC